MKKIMKTMIVGTLTLIFVGCTHSQQNIGVEGGLTVTFEATIMTLNESSAIVVPLQDEVEILASGDQVSIALPKGLEVEVGDEVSIEYDGSIMESYPLQIHTISVNGIAVNDN